ncbi:MAG: hypothetical protein ABSA97_01370 [Verrucomicrobiia bacterium]
MAFSSEEWRGEKITARQKGVLLFFGYSTRGLSRGEASDVITKLFDVPRNKQLWEKTKNAEVREIKGTKLYDFIRRNHDIQEGDTVDLALDSIACSDMASERDEELAELDRWLKRPDRWDEPSVRRTRRRPSQAQVSSRSQAAKEMIAKESEKWLGDTMLGCCGCLVVLVVLLVSLVMALRSCL